MTTIAMIKLSPQLHKLETVVHKELHIRLPDYTAVRAAAAAAGDLIELLYSAAGAAGGGGGVGGRC